MGLRNHTIMERTLDDVFLSGTNHHHYRGGGSSSSTFGFSTSVGDRDRDRGNNNNNNNNNNQTIVSMELNKLPWIPLMKLDAQGTGYFRLLHKYFFF